MAAGPLLDDGAVAQLGERLLCKQDVIGSIPVSSTTFSLRNKSTETCSTLSFSGDRELNLEPCARAYLRVSSGCSIAIADDF